MHLLSHLDGTWSGDKHSDNVLVVNGLEKLEEFRLLIVVSITRVLDSQWALHFDLRGESYSMSSESSSF